MLGLDQRFSNLIVSVSQQWFSVQDEFGKVRSEMEQMRKELDDTIRRGIESLDTKTDVRE